MSLLHQLNIYLAHLQEKFYRSPSSEVIQLDIPYFAQWESPDMIADFIQGSKTADQDPLWANSGASSPQEYQQWAKHCCGMACLKMILADHLHQVIPVVKLAQDCAQFGGYTLPLEQTVGLQYQPFQKYLQQTFNLQSTIARPLTLHKIIKALHHQQYVMASVASNIDQAPQQPSSTGHLILITGYDKQQRTITFHNPGGQSTSTQAHSQLSFDQFANYFKYKGLIITPTPAAHPS